MHVGKRILDLSVSAVGLWATAPVLGPVLLAVWGQDRHSPFYVAPRVGRGRQPFRMVKVRSMIINANAAGVDSTSAQDRRITPLGKAIRRFKIDEVPQLWNVLKGEMSLVGPRPNVERGVMVYTDDEMHLLDVPPGITDFASIVFADEGDILADSQDPDLDYDRLIRPWKSRLGLFYVKHANPGLDLKLILLTVLASIDRRRALQEVSDLLAKLGAPADLVCVARRELPLVPTSPPGTNEIADRWEPEVVAARRLGTDPR